MGLSPKLHLYLDKIRFAPVGMDKDKLPTNWFEEDFVHQWHPTVEKQNCHLTKAGFCCSLVMVSTMIVFRNSNEFLNHPSICLSLLGEKQVLPVVLDSFKANKPRGSLGTF